MRTAILCVLLPGLALAIPAIVYSVARDSSGCHRGLSLRSTLQIYGIARITLTALHVATLLAAAKYRIKILRVGLYFLLPLDTLLYSALVVWTAVLLSDNSECQLSTQNVQIVVCQAGLGIVAVVLQCCTYTSLVFQMFV